MRTLVSIPHKMLACPQPRLASNLHIAISVLFAFGDDVFMPGCAGIAQPANSVAPTACHIHWLDVVFKPFVVWDDKQQAFHRNPSSKDLWGQSPQECIMQGNALLGALRPPCGLLAASVGRFGDFPFAFAFVIGRCVGGFFAACHRA